METDTILLTVGILIGVVGVLTIRYAHLKRGERDEGHIPYPPVALEEGGFQKPWEVAKIVAGIVVACLIVWPVICHAQTAPTSEATELQRLRAELEVERAARRQAEADAAEALSIAREAAARLEEADDSFVPLLMGSATQRVPHSSAVMYVDRLPPGMASEDVLTVSCNGTGSCRSWLLVMIGNEPATLPLNGQQPSPLRVSIDGVRTTLSLLPPGSRGYVAGVEGETTVRLVVFEGSPTDANGLRFAGVKHESGPRLRLVGAYKTDVGFRRYGGEVDAVKAILLQSRPLVSGR